MRRSHARRAGRAGRSRVGAAFALIPLVLLLGACDGLLDVEAAGFVDADDLVQPERAGLLVSGAVADFECALGAYIVNSAVLGNELRDASVTAARFPLDQRIISETSPYGVNTCAGNPPGIYRPLSTARWSADNALELLDEWTDAEVPNRTDLIAQAAAHSGYSHVLLGEGFCSVVIEEHGSEVQPADAFEAAVARFTRAIDAARAVGNAEIENMALLGRARAQLNLGNDTEAAADAGTLLENDPQFERIRSTSTASSRRWNRLGDEFSGGRVTVDPLYRDLEVDGVPDPRVEAFDTGTLGHDSATPVWMVTKVGAAREAVPLRTRPLTVGTWREAHLIIAEAEGGDEAVDRINILREHWDLPTFAGGTDAEVREQVIEERSRELYLEGHHLNDLRRFDLPQLPAPGSAYRQGGQYGSVRCFELPAVERNTNPNVD
jgi:starch-binding outer membrane protein, SusD/RagB family